MRIHFVVLGLLLSLSACGGGSDRNPSSPTQPPFASGTWQGSFTTDAGVSAGTLRLVLAHETNGRITGSASLAVSSLTLPSGEVNGGLQPGQLPPADIGLAIVIGGACPATLAAPSRFTSLTTLEGQVAGGNPACGLDVRGRFSLQKQ